ncbi:Uncharacterised protein [Raoultella terrigena]|uniref:Uncharacterized protein n=1 Tax=Raoultella terrigena TaxID=577 RepID=A0A7Z8Z7N6_RAOTE|nr:Uncharacterised protein [Raoultella terrigena]
MRAFAPVAIERFVDPGVRRAEGVKQLGRRPRYPVAGNHLRLRRLHFRQTITLRNQRLVAAGVNDIGLL